MKLKVLYSCLIVFFLLVVSWCSSSQEFSLSTLPAREWDRPLTTDAPPWTMIAHQQQSQNSSVELQNQLRARMQTLKGVTIDSSDISVQWARAINSPNSDWPKIIGNERIHLHPEYDWSLHMAWLPEELTVLVTKWRAEFHPRNPWVVMLYWPRDMNELELIWSIILDQHTRLHVTD